MSVSPHEQLAAEQGTLAELQAGREFAAQHAAEVQLRGAFSPGIVFERRNAVGSVERNWSGLYDQRVIDSSTLLALDAIGLDSHELLTKSVASDMGEEVASKTIDQERLDIFSYDQGLSFRLSTTTENSGLKDGQPSEAINVAFRNRLLQSPAHLALLRASEKLSLADTVPEEMATEPFDYTKDPLGTLVFFDSVGLTDSSRNNSLVQGITKDGASNEQLLRNVLNVAAGSSNGRTIELKDGATIITWQYRPSSPIVKTVELRADGTCVYRAKQVAMNAYLEQANQSAESMSLPFIETETASELASVLDKAGLMFHPKLQYEMMNTDEADRYGSLYTQLSRRIAKWVDNPDSLNLSDLFVPHDPAYSGIELARRDKSSVIQEYGDMQESLATESHEEAVRAAYTAVDRNGETGEASEALFTMIDDLLAIAHDPALKQHTDLPVTKERVKIRDGACFDVVAYYVGAAAEARGGLQHYQENNVAMLEKTMGAHTFLTTSPVQFNGVRLPKGSLFQRAQDGGWAFLRLTPFAFENTADQLAFGSEISKMLTNERQAVSRLGGVSMQSMVNFAR